MSTYNTAIKWSFGQFFVDSKPGDLDAYETWETKNYITSPYGLSIAVDIESENEKINLQIHVDEKVKIGTHQLIKQHKTLTEHKTIYFYSPDEIPVTSSTVTVKVTSKQTTITVIHATENNYIVYLNDTNKKFF